MFSVRPITAQEQIVALNEEAAKDNHAVLFPSHVIQNAENKVVGYFSLARMPTVNVWTSTKETTAKESLHLLSCLDSLMADMLKTNPAPIYAMPCQEDSPYFELMEKMGFQKLGGTVMFVKNLNLPVPVAHKTVEDCAKLTREAQTKTAEAIAKSKVTQFPRNDATPHPAIAT